MGNGIPTENGEVPLPSITGWKSLRLPLGCLWLRSALVSLQLSEESPRVYYALSEYNHRLLKICPLLNYRTVCDTQINFDYISLYFCLVSSGWRKGAVLSLCGLIIMLFVRSPQLQEELCQVSAVWISAALHYAFVMQ